MPSKPSTAMGCIPEKLRIIIAYGQELKKTIDGHEIKELVRPAMFQDIRTKPDAAIRWGTMQRQTNPDVTNYRDREWETVEPQVEEIDNEPITNLKFWAIDERAEGGRAYKVINEQGLLFDMREDVVEEAFFYNEFQDGMFTGQYIWGKCHSQMRLIRLNSKMYDELMEAGRRKKLKKIPNKELEVGGVYENRKGERSVYLGRKPGKVQDGGGMFFLDLRRFLPYGEEPNSDHQVAFDRVIEVSTQHTYYGPYAYDSQSMVAKVGTVYIKGHEV